MSEKIKVKVFLPVGVCSCSLTGFLASIYQAVGKYKDIVEYSEDSVISNTAKDLGVRSQGVLVGSQYLAGNVPAAKIESVILAEISKAS
ncbi:MAG: hypothetical protein ACTSXE_01300 [Candidatus Thorarchaeota archaeon]